MEKTKSETDKEKSRSCWVVGKRLFGARGNTSGVSESDEYSKYDAHERSVRSEGASREYVELIY